MLKFEICKKHLHPRTKIEQASKLCTLSSSSYNIVLVFVRSVPYKGEDLVDVHSNGKHCEGESDVATICQDTNKLNAIKVLVRILNLTH